MNFPTVIDSSLLATWRACPTSCRRTYFEHWKPATQSVHLVAGAAFAAGLEVARQAFFIEGTSSDDALLAGVKALWRHYGEYEPPVDSPKGPLRMAGALEYYFSQYPLGSDGATPHRFGPNHHGIEFSFLEPLEINHPETGDPLLYSGRADMVCDAFGSLFLFDEKTTTQLGPTWPKKWDQRAQFTAYCWGLQRAGYRPAGVVVRGIALYKEDYGTAQAITYRSNWEIDRWYQQTLRDLARIIQAWRTDIWDFNLDDSCTAYGGCEYNLICKAPIEHEKIWLKMYFHRRRWDPVTREEVALD